MERHLIMLSKVDLETHGASKYARGGGKILGATFHRERILSK